MVVIAEAFLQVLGKKAINDALYLQPPIDIILCYRYVDDSHARFPNFVSAENFQQILNAQHDKIQYIIEIKYNIQLNKIQYIIEIKYNIQLNTIQYTIEIKYNIQLK